MSASSVPSSIIGVSQACYDRIKEDWQNKGRRIRGVKTFRMTFSGDPFVSSITFEDGKLYSTDPVKGKREIEVLEHHMRQGEVRDLSPKGIFASMLVRHGLDADKAFHYASLPINQAIFRAISESGLSVDAESRVLAEMVSGILTRHGISMS